MTRTAASMSSGTCGFAWRAARPEDAPEVAACVEAAYRHYVSGMGIPPGPMTEDYDTVIRDFQVTVVEHAGRIVGVLVLTVASEGFLLENVAVLPEYQGRGLGRELLTHAEAEARRQGFGSIYLYTHERMTENQAMYGKNGYVEYARRLELGLHRIYMRKRLHPVP